GVFGLRGRANQAAGVSGKWALEGFMRTLAVEVGKYNINVNAICPGYVDGVRAAAAIERIAASRGVSAEAVRLELERQTALRRLATETDIVNAALFLASEDSRNITGQDLVVDAGWTL